MFVSPLWYFLDLDFDEAQAAEVGVTLLPIPPNWNEEASHYRVLRVCCKSDAKTAYAATSDVQNFKDFVYVRNKCR
jgi:hypothetical protein